VDNEQEIVSLSADTGIFRLPPIVNEPVRSYAPGSGERDALSAALATMAGETYEMPSVIAGREVRTGILADAVMPHRHAHVLGQAHQARPNDVLAAIAAAKEASSDWSCLPWTERAAIFLKAADLLSGPWRNRLNAATMLGQSKTVHQAEIDSAAELIDFWRFNVSFARRIYEDQPISSPGTWNRVDYRPLEGFVLAITPFNFTAIAGNLPSAPALMGNTVVWKPAATAMLSAHLIMQLLRAAGLPDGVINLVYGEPEVIVNACLADEAFAGLHFTGSTLVFNRLLSQIYEDLSRYRTYPRVVGETGGKNFILAHPSANLDALTTAIIRGGFEYQGQKCSAASRVFIPQSIWPYLKRRLVDEIATIKTGEVTDFSNFMGAVIDEKAWRRHAIAIATAKRDTSSELITGGGTDKTLGYFVQPTLIQTEDLSNSLMQDELFGPIVAVHAFPDRAFNAMTAAINEQSRYGLTGAVFATERAALLQAAASLRHSAGNLYLNDKPTGAIVGQQPFGGARHSGTNDKAGSALNLMRWISPRTIKETFAPPVDYRHPHLGPRG
jgi:1-pyrroline-5-carboxylate dehydrogenase